MLCFTQQYRTYYSFDKFDDVYELQSPVLSAHNLIIGSMYIDIGDTMYLVN